MKRNLISAVLMALSLSAVSQVTEWDGVTVIEDVYGQKISSNGNIVVGWVGDGGCVVYNISDQTAEYYPDFDYGRGHVVSDNGIVVGCKLFEDLGSNLGVIAKDGRFLVPEVLKNFESSNIHSITPDCSRVCGVVAGGKRGYDNVPFYSDVDADGNLGEIHYLPVPEKDFFGYRPQYVTATWINSDGNVIAGQVKDMRGFFLYPIVFIQDERGEWSYTLPSEKEFNPLGLTIPALVGDIEDEFPDAPFPELSNYMDPQDYLRFIAAGEPYEDLDKYMTPEEYRDYDEALNKYWDAQEEYNLLFENYMSRYWEILDTSLVSSYLIQNALALSGDGKWLATSFTKFLPMDGVTEEHYVPYLCNLDTGEWIKCIDSDLNMHVNQVLPGGVTLFNNLSNGLVPASTYLYFPSSKANLTLAQYLSDRSPKYTEWMENYLQGEIIVDIDSNGNLQYEEATVTGQAAISEDFNTVVSGVDGYVFNYDMYFTYIFGNLEAGIESIVSERPDKGIFTVYDLQGVKRLQTTHSEEIKILPAGIYIINGKKVTLE